MAREFFKDLPNTTTPLSSSRLNGLLDGEEAMGSIVVDNISGKNLFNKGNFNYLIANIDATGNIVSTAGCRTIFVEIKSNTTYTVQKILSSRFRVATYTSIPKVGSTTSNYTENLSTQTSVSITSGANDKYLAVWLYYDSTDTSTTLDSILASVQIEVGDTATTYTPYNQPIKQTSLGVKENCTFYADDFKCKNLYKGSQDFSGYWNNASNWTTDSSNYNGLTVKKRDGQWAGLSKDIQVEQGKTYTFSLFAKSDSSRPFAIYTAGGTATTTPELTTNNTTNNWERYTFTFTANATGTVRLRLENTSSDTGNYTYICGYQLEIGEATPYTLYKAFENEEIYSTIEIRIGTWSNGKPLYRKTVNTSTINLTANTWTTLTTDSNISSLTKVYVGENTDFVGGISAPMMGRKDSSNNIQVYSFVAYSIKSYILEYTKTTD